MEVTLHHLTKRFPASSKKGKDVIEDVRSLENVIRVRAIEW